MPLSPGTKLACYEVLAPLGAGAMGEVWRARDTRLGREVAIKVLPERFAADQERLQRFEREARTLATVNHPNVAQIFGVDRVDGTSFLVLELVPGETLADRLQRGPMRLDEVLAVCRQIAAGVEAAHEAGVIHRDLKPANVRLTPDGKAKVLDFGLAKLAQEVPDGSAGGNALATESGCVLGTPTYMAPEQARGGAVDKRADIWAFGCVLYECLTRRRAFKGTTTADVLGAVMRAQPDLAALSQDTPPRVRELVARCLAKDPHDRLRDIGEARIELGRAPEPDARSARAASPWTWAAVAALVAVAAASAFLAGTRYATPSGPVVRSTVVLPAGSMPDTYSGGSLALSPDGRTLVYAAYHPEGGRILWLRPLERLDAQPIPGTEGASYPFRSPDGSTIAFFADERLKRIPLAGGAATTICDAPSGRGGSWSLAGAIAFAPESTGPLHSVAASGGVSTQLTRARSGTTHRRPWFLPDGKRLLFSDQGDAEGGIMLLDVESGVIDRVTEDGSEGMYAPPGVLLFVRRGNLMFQPFDASTGSLSGEPRMLAEDVTFNPLRMSGVFSVSDEGTLAYMADATPISRLDWLDPDGRTIGSLGDPAPFVRIRLSPGGERIAAVVADGRGQRDLWILDAERGLGSPLVEDIGAWGEESMVAWSPDGRQIAYTKWEKRPADGPVSHPMDAGHW